MILWGGSGGGVREEGNGLFEGDIARDPEFVGDRIKAPIALVFGAIPQEYALDCPMGEFIPQRVRDVNKGKTTKGAKVSITWWFTIQLLIRSSALEHGAG